MSPCLRPSPRTLRRTATLASVLLGLAAAIAPAAPPAAASDADFVLADVAGDHALLYLQLDAAAFEKGARESSIAGLLREPESRDFLAPLFEQQPMLDSADPVGAVLDHLALRDWLAGRLALAVFGVALRMPTDDGGEQWLRVDAGHPMDASFLHRLAGPAEDGLPFDAVALDFLLSVEPGPSARQHVEQFLQAPPSNFVVGSESIGGRSIRTVTIREQGAPEVRVFADLSGPRWLLGGDRASFERALGGDVERPLSADPHFRSARERVAGPGNVLFAHVAVSRFFEWSRALWPPIVVEEAEMLGLTSFRGLDVGVSMVEGGVRETLLVALDERPGGLFAYLDALGGGFPSLADAPVETAAFFGLRFDAQRLLETSRTVVKQLAPRLAGPMEQGLADVDVFGLSLVDDLLPALGSEALVCVEPPRGGPIPEAFLSLEVRDEERFARLLAALQQELGGAGGAEFLPLPLQKDGVGDGFSLKLEGAPVQPAFGVWDGRLHGALTGPALKGLLAGGPSGRETLGRDGEVFRRVMAGLNGGRQDALALAAYVDLRAFTPTAYAWLSPVLPGLIDEMGLPLDAALLPLPETFQRHLTGVALAVSRDAHGVEIEAFTPTGILPLGVAAAAMEAERAQARAEQARARAMEARRESEEIRKAVDEAREMARREAQEN